MNRIGRFIPRSRVIAAAAAALSIAACGSSDKRPDLNVAILGDKVTARTGYPAQALGMATAQGLVGFDANGQIEPALAQSWIVTDDALSYIFRLHDARWPDGRTVQTREIARMLNAAMRDPNQRYRHELAAIDRVTAMTRSVIEIRLRRPMPRLFELLAQPELGFRQGSGGSGPLTAKPDGNALLLQATGDGDDGVRHMVRVQAMSARDAIAYFAARRVDAVLGGRFQDFPRLTGTNFDRQRIVIDPADGVFGLAVRETGPLLRNQQVRRALSLAIDRDAFVTTVARRGWASFTPGGDDASDKEDASIAQRKVLAYAILTRARVTDDAVGQLLGANPAHMSDRAAPLTIWLPPGPGSDILIARLKEDWAPLHIDLLRAASATQADLVLVDEVAPMADAAWPLQRLSCARLPVCDSEADKMVAMATTAADSAEREQMLQSASRRIADTAGFIAIAVPLRWSLASSRVPGLQANPRARHPLNRLTQTTN